MCSFETLLFLISFSVFGEANCMFIRIHYLCVSDITPFFFSLILHLKHTHKHTKIFFGCCFFFLHSWDQFLLVLLLGIFDYYSTTCSLFVVRMLCSFHVMCSSLYMTANGGGILYVTLYFGIDSIQKYQATVAAISSREVFNSSSTLMNYSNEPDIFATDLQRRMPLACRFALLLFPINKCLKCKVACTSIFTRLSHTLYLKFELYTIYI